MMTQEKKIDFCYFFCKIILLFQNKALPLHRLKREDTKRNPKILKRVGKAKNKQRFYETLEYNKGNRFENRRLGNSFADKEMTRLPGGGKPASPLLVFRGERSPGRAAQR